VRQTGLCEAEQVVEIARMAAVDHGFDLSREQFLRSQNQKRARRGIRKSRCRKDSRRDSAHNNEHKLMTLPIDEFLRRFLLHLLPKGFVRIRNFGFLANRRRAVLLPLSFHSLGAAQEPRAEQAPLAQTTFGAALCVVDRWWSSKGSRLQKSNFVLRHWSSLQHDTALPSSNPSRASARFVPLRLSAEQISSFSVFNHAY
jgi:Putative transposase